MCQLPAECFDPGSRIATKHYATAISQKVDPKYKGLLFHVKQDVIRNCNARDRKVANVERLVFSWLKNKINYSKFNTLWKATNVKEIIEEELIQAGGKASIN